MSEKYEIDKIVKGIEISWTTWGKMRGENLVTGEINYLKSENDKGFERIYSVNITQNQNFEIQKMISYIKAGIMPDSLLITPNTKPSDLAEILCEKGFIINDSSPCMLMYLSDYKEAACKIENFTISHVTDKETLAFWLAIVNKALFECELVTLEQFTDLLSLNNINFYLGLINNQPVTACMTITNSDTSVLEMVATLSGYRRNGYATQVINKALLDLKHKQIKTISLRAEADGVSVYKKLGFREYFKRIVASCDWNSIYKKACPCFIEAAKIEKAKAIYDSSDSIDHFIFQMNEEKVIGRNISFNPGENAIYITKMYACDCGGGCPLNNTVIGQRCHCEYVNHFASNLHISYCNCAAAFFEPMFVSLFGEKISIEPVKTVLSGAEECVFRVKL